MRAVTGKLGKDEGQASSEERKTGVSHVPIRYQCILMTCHTAARVLPVSGSAFTKVEVATPSLKQVNAEETEKSTLGSSGRGRTQGKLLSPTLK